MAKKKKRVDKAENEYIKLTEKLADKVIKSLTTDYVVSVLMDSVKYDISNQLKESGFSDFDMMHEDVSEMVFERIQAVLSAVKF